MHPEAFAFVKNFATSDPISVIEIGSRNLNGTARPLFPNAKWIGLDLLPGPCVDVACDAATYEPEELCDVVVCCEVLEHAGNWRELIDAASRWLKPDGRFIMTCAGPGRPEHSAIDGQPRLMPGEYYENRTALEISQAMQAAGFGWIESDEVGQDTQAVGWKIARD